MLIHRNSNNFEIGTKGCVIKRGVPCGAPLSHIINSSFEFYIRFLLCRVCTTVMSH